MKAKTGPANAGPVHYTYTSTPRFQRPAGFLKFDRIVILLPSRDSVDTYVA